MNNTNINNKKRKVYMNYDGLNISDIIDHIDEKDRYIPSEMPVPKTNKVYFAFVGAMSKRYIKEFFYKKVKTYISNGVKLDITINDKSFLHNYMRKNHQDLFKKYFMAQYDIDNNYKVLDSLDSAKWYITKPIPGYSGMGQKIFLGNKGVREHIETFDRSTFESHSKKIQKWVIQEYIMNPLLIKHKKFHLRVIILVYDNRALIHDDMKVISAKKEYTMGTMDKEVHDTHAKYTKDSEKTVFPKNHRDIDGWENINNGIIAMFKKFNEIGLFKHACYESKKCFRFLGVDVIITDDHQIKCLEMNYSPQIKLYPTKNILKGMVEIIINKKESDHYVEL